jgi:low affinity Fe/Cu permease
MHPAQRPLPTHRNSSLFAKFARATSYMTGHPAAFLSAAAIILIWIVTGPIFNFSDTWQLVINTGTTIVTFLMVFLIQNTQNRDSAAVQLKLDELIRSSEHAHNALLDLEELTDRELYELKCRYEELADKARGAIRKGKRDTGRPDFAMSSPKKST